MAIADAGRRHFIERGWRVVDDVVSKDFRRIKITSDVEGGAELTFEWRRRGGRWQTKAASARIGGSGEFPISHTAVWYVGSQVPPEDAVRMVKQRAPAAVRASHGW